MKELSTQLIVLSSINHFYFVSSPAKNEIDAKAAQVVQRANEDIDRDKVYSESGFIQRAEKQAKTISNVSDTVKSV